MFNIWLGQIDTELKHSTTCISGSTKQVLQFGCNQVRPRGSCSSMKNTVPPPLLPPSMPLSSLQVPGQECRAHLQFFGAPPNNQSIMGTLFLIPFPQVDPFHTLFGVAGLSLLGSYKNQLKAVNPVFCMPEETLTRLGVRTQLLWGRGGITDIWCNKVW